eukprot:CAMPEP_0176011882 /NCGR_PEP_ID=MMETSP0120_2-20121206/5510_1 /TAXON_ID=160619 /ORGANISM="Kryptoperidinium foliaceum, Strain CCMP 1326" /LENGTH=168 /DNA_ID=CAMNT_0017344753 /DNA_START=110 /DNA_END=612 /DNA_ORIENTATION=-
MAVLRHSGSSKLPLVSSVELDFEQQVNTEGKLVFLFLLQDRLPHAELWGRFFEGAPQGTFGAYAHCVDKAACERQADLRQMGVDIGETVASKPCVDMVTPVHALLARALRPMAAGGVQKFILVDGATLPLKPLMTMRRILLRHNVSDICISPAEEWASSEVRGSKLYV